MQNKNFDEFNLKIIKKLKNNELALEFFINFHEQLNYSTIPIKLIFDIFINKLDTINDNPYKNILENIISKNTDVFFMDKNYLLLLELDFQFTIEQIIKHKIIINELPINFFNKINLQQFLCLEKNSLFSKKDIFIENNYLLEDNLFEYLENKKLILNNDKYNPLELFILELANNNFKYKENKKIDFLLEKYTIQDNNFLFFLDKILSKNISIDIFKNIIKNSEKEYDIYKHIDIKKLISYTGTFSNKKKSYLVINYCLKENLDILNFLDDKKLSKLIIDLLINNNIFTYKNLISPFILRKKDLSIFDFTESFDGCFFALYDTYSSYINKDNNIISKIEKKDFPLDIIQEKGAVFFSELINLKIFFNLPEEEDIFMINFLIKKGQQKTNIKKLLLLLEKKQNICSYFDKLSISHNNIYNELLGYIFKNTDLKSIYEKNILLNSFKDVKHEKVIRRI